MHALSNSCHPINNNRSINNLPLLPLLFLSNMFGSWPARVPSSRARCSNRPPKWPQWTTWRRRVVWWKLPLQTRQKLPFASLHSSWMELNRMDPRRLHLIRSQRICPNFLWLTPLTILRIPQCQQISRINIPRRSLMAQKTVTIFHSCSSSSIQKPPSQTKDTLSWSNQLYNLHPKTTHSNPWFKIAKMANVTHVSFASPSNYSRLPQTIISQFRTATLPISPFLPIHSPYHQINNKYPHQRIKNRWPNSRVLV